MKNKNTDILIIFLLLSLPLFGILQACGAGGPVYPGPEEEIPQPPPVDNHAPVIVLSIVSPEEGPTPFTAKLDATETFDPDGDEIEFLWLFSDGYSTAGRTAEHEFTRSGRHEVRLIVTDQWGTADDEGPMVFSSWGLANSPWPKFAHDERNSGVSQNVGPMMDLENANNGGAFPRYWRGGVGNTNVNAVCIGYNNMVVYSQGTWLRARSESGMTLWDVEAESEITAWPAIAFDGSIILGTRDGWVHRIGENGEIIWSTRIVEENGQPVVLDSAVNMDGNGNIYIAGYSEEYEYYYIGGGEDYHILRAYLASITFNGVVTWTKAIIQVWGYYNYNDPGPIIPALTEDGNIIVNGSWGYMFSEDGDILTPYKFILGTDILPQYLGPPSISEEGMVAFTHGRLPLFNEDGTFIMEMTGELLHHTSDGANIAGHVQAPVWGSDYILQTQLIQSGYTSPGLVQRTLGGFLQNIHLKNSRGWNYSVYYAGATQDSLGRIYISCQGLHAFTPISTSSVFPHVPRRYSLWHYERGDTHMTAPVIGENGWMYMGWGPDIMAIGD